MLTLVAFHDDSTLCLQFPSSLVDVKHYDVHAKVEGCLLCGKACAERIVEEDEHGCLVLAKRLILITVVLYLKGIVECFSQIAYV